MAAFASSYIKTEASAVTRAADAASMTGTNFSSWYRADEGTMYAEYSSAAPNILGSARRLFSISNATDANRIVLSMGNAGGVSDAFISVNSIAQANFTTTIMSLNGGKAALVYKQNDIAYVYNAAAALTDTDALIPVVNSAYIGISETGTSAAERSLNGTIKRIAYYPAKLSSTQLQALTS